MDVLYLRHVAAAPQCPLIHIGLKAEVPCSSVFILNLEITSLENNLTTRSSDFVLFIIHLFCAYFWRRAWIQNLASK